MPELTLTDLAPATRATSTRAAALTEVRQALSMITADPYARSLLPTNPHPPSAPPALTALTDWLYARWWCGPGLRADRARDDDAAARTGAAQGAARLEAGRRVTAPRSSGWLVLAAVGDVLVAARLTTGPGAPSASRQRITTTPDAAVSSSRPGLSPRPGDLVTVRHGASGLDPAYAWWWAHSTRPEDLTDCPLDRWYVHARDLSAAASLVPLLLAVAAEADCPITLKCPPTEAGYGRRDALVVYLPRALAGRAEDALLRRAAELAPLVRPDVPPLTRQLLPGVARAEDPGRGLTSTSADADGADGAGTDADTGAADDQLVSYGQLRCGQVASVAIALLSAGDQPPDSTRLDTRRLGLNDRNLNDRHLDDQTIADALNAVGIDLDAIERVA